MRQAAGHLAQRIDPRGVGQARLQRVDPCLFSHRAGARPLPPGAERRPIDEAGEGEQQRGRRQRQPVRPARVQAGFQDQRLGRAADDAAGPHGAGRTGLTGQQPAVGHGQGQDDARLAPEGARLVEQLLGVDSQHQAMTRPGRVGAAFDHHVMMRPPGIGHQRDAARGRTGGIADHVSDLRRQGTGADHRIARIERDELHIVDARVEMRDRRGDIQEEIAFRPGGRRGDGRKSRQVRVVLAGPLGHQPVEGAAFAFQCLGQRPLLPQRHRAGCQQQRQAPGQDRPASWTSEFARLRPIPHRRAPRP